MNEELRGLLTEIRDAILEVPRDVCHMRSKRAYSVRDNLNCIADHLEAALLAQPETERDGQIERGQFYGKGYKSWRDLLPEAAGALAGEGAAAYDSWSSIVEDMRDAENRKESQRPPLSYWRARVAALSAAPVAAQERCAHGVRHPHPCRECEDAPVAAQQPAVVGDGPIGTITRLDCGDEALDHRIDLDPEFEESLCQYPAGSAVNIYAYPSADVATEHVRAAIAALTTAATPVPVGGEDERLCKYCGSPTMHMGDICFACGKAAKRLALAHQPQDGRKGEEG